MYPRILEYNRVTEYNREKAITYAHRWAYGRNPAYYDFHNIGGDCTNFASQVIYAGSGIMNHTPTFGWYYINANNRTSSWTGVNYLYNFLINNKGAGPFAEEVDVKDVIPGDIVQLSFVGNNFFNHSPVIVHSGNLPKLGSILIATHTDDRDFYSLTNYRWVDIRFIHIKGIRK